jgi:hypothetical protein
MDPDVGSKIRDLTRNELRYAWDTISITASAQICADALSSRSDLGLRYGNLLPVQSPREDVETITTVMYTAFGRYFKFGDQDMYASQEDYEFGRMFYAMAEQLMAQVWVISLLHSNSFPFSVNSNCMLTKTWVVGETPDSSRNGG